MEGTIGEIKMFAGDYAPRGWAMCNGQLLTIDQNNNLYAVLGNTYGGDGKTTFALPDFRGRIPIGSGEGPGLSKRKLGEKGGEETITLTEQNMPPHNHQLMVSSLPPTTPAVNRTNSPKDSLLGDYPATAQIYYKSTASDKLNTMHPDVIATTGASQPHTNMPPFLGIHFIICIAGSYPFKMDEI